MGVEVAASAAPVDALRVGDKVLLVSVPGVGDVEEATSGEAITEGRVHHVTSGAPGQALVTHVSVIVPLDLAPTVAAASAAQQIAVVVTG